MTIGEKIKELRERREMNLSRLAELAGVSKGYLSSLEREQARNPSVDTLAKIAEALGVRSTDLMEEGSPTAPASTPLPPGLEAFVAERRERGEPLSPEDVEMLLAIRYRGRRPETAGDWSYLYETIRRTIG